MSKKNPRNSGATEDRPATVFPVRVGLVIIILFLLVVVAEPGYASGTTGDPLGQAPVNPAFAQYLQKTQSHPVLNLSALRASAAAADPLGLIPTPVSRSGVTEMPVLGASFGSSAYPATFDLRNSGKVTPVRDQTYFGTCWAFASLASVESSLMPADPAPDFSEKNLANLAGFDFDIPDGGGNMWMSTAYLTRWNGPVNEVSDPYPSGKTWDNTSATYPPVNHVQNVVFFPGRSSRADTTDIKKALTNGGAVYSSFYWDRSFYNATPASYFEPEAAADPSSGGGHAVTIVGWDNNWEAANFTSPAPAPGAWIVKNSWGTTWGDNGYFYLSYYDKYFASAVQLSGDYWDTGEFLGESTSGYTSLYSYDTHGDISDYYVNTQKNGSFANVFTATSPGILAAVGFYTTDLNVPCTISIYKNPASGPVNTTPDARFNTTLATMGYHTVTVPSGLRVPLAAGDRFSVVVEVANPSNDYYIPTEINYAGYTHGIVSQYGRSYVLGSSGWEDWKDDVDNSTICIKAYTAPVLAATGGTGGDSGSSGVGGSTAVTASGIVAGQPATFSFNQNPRATAPVALDAVQITFSSSPGMADVVGLPVNDGGSPPGQTTVGYLEIEPVGINQDSVSQGVISFSVNGPYLASHGIDPAQVVLMRNHDSRWTALPTTLLRQSGDTYYYQATTPGFSYFAIVAGTRTVAENRTVAASTLAQTAAITGPLPATVTGSGTPAPAAAATRSPAVPAAAPVQTTPVPGGTSEGSGGFPVTILALTGAGSVLLIGACWFIRRWWIRRQNPALFQEYD
jgi:PGF-pre-PGF domain-containing protein